MITIKPFVFNAFQENTYLLFDESLECVIIDPGMSSAAEQEELAGYIEARKLQPKAMVNTHCHVDHILGCKYVKEQYKIPFYIHPEEKLLLERAADFGEFFGMQIEQPPAADKFLNEGETFRFGKSSFTLFHVPGHSPGSLSIYSESDNFIITGDALFKGSIGRTDLPGGDYNTLITNIKSKILTLPRKVAVFPGHGPSTTVGEEHDTNPFLT